MFVCPEKQTRRLPGDARAARRIFFYDAYFWYVGVFELPWTHNDVLVISFISESSHDCFMYPESSGGAGFGARIAVRT